MRLSMIVVAGLAASGGCAVGPSTRVQPLRPAVAMPGDSITSRSSRLFLDSLARSRDSTRSDSADAGIWHPASLTLDTKRDLMWLEVFKDSQLVALVKTALTNNRDLQAVTARVREYRASLGAARADLFPQISANGAVSHNQAIFGDFPTQTFDAVKITGDLSWELDFWGRLRRQTESARFDWQGREEEQRAAVLTLISDVATAYLQLRAVDEDLAISEQTLESRRSTLELARRRLTQGVISELDVRQFEAEAAAPAVSLADFARQRAELEHRLSVLIGKAPGPIARGEPLVNTVQAMAVPESIPSELLGRRPDVLQAQADWQAAIARVGAAVGNRLPKLSFAAEYGTQRPDFTRLFSSSAEIYALQGGMSIPLFTGGRLLNQVRASQARADQAKAVFEQTVLTASQEASDALVGLRLSRDQLAAQETQASALRRAFALAQRRYESGVASYLEVLDAQRGLFSAELSLVQTENQYLGATVRLYKALGGEWEMVGKTAQ